MEELARRLAETEPTVRIDHDRRFAAAEDADGVVARTDAFGLHQARSVEGRALAAVGADLPGDMELDRLGPLEPPLVGGHAHAVGGVDPHDAQVRRLLPRKLIERAAAQPLEPERLHPDPRRVARNGRSTEGAGADDPPDAIGRVMNGARMVPMSAKPPESWMACNW